MKWQDALNIAGSIASITGVSFIWLRTLLPAAEQVGLWLGLLGSFIGSLLTIGLIALAIELLLSGANAFVANSSNRLKVVYWSFAVSLTVAACASLLALIWGFVFVMWSMK